MPADRVKELGVGFLDRLAGFSQGGLVGARGPDLGNLVSARLPNVRPAGKTAAPAITHAPVYHVAQGADRHRAAAGDDG